MDELLYISEALKEGLKNKTSIPKTSFDLWFGDLMLTALTESKATFSTPTKVREKILSTKYKDTIRAVFLK
jgi:chromosomal replication initiation ATPase DnaA